MLTQLQEKAIALCLKNQKFATVLFEKTSNTQLKLFDGEYAKIFAAISSSIQKYGKVDQDFILYSLSNSDNAEDTIKVYEKIKTIPLEDLNEEFLWDFAKDFFVNSTLFDTLSKIQRLKKSSEILEKMRVGLSEIDKVDGLKDSNESICFDPDKDIPKIEDYIPTGIAPFDEAMAGRGIPMGSLVIILGGTNLGKSTLSIDLAVNAMKHGFNVLHVALDGRQNEAKIKYLSNITGIPLSKFYKGDLSTAELSEVKKATEKFSDKIKIINIFDYTPKVEGLVAKLESLKKEFNYNMLVVDYIGVLSTSERVSTLREVNVITHRTFARFAKKHKIVVVSPAQSNRSAQVKNFGKELKDKAGRYIMRSTDIAESDDIGRVSEVIMSINVTDEEMAEGKARLYLEKQRIGKKGILVGVKTELECSRINSKEYYDPDSVVENSFDAIVSGAKPSDRVVLDCINLLQKSMKNINQLESDLSNIQESGSDSEVKKDVIKKVIKQELNKAKENLAIVFGTVELDGVKISADDPHRDAKDGLLSFYSRALKLFS